MRVCGCACAWQGSLVAAGLCMLVLGGTALFGIQKSSWLVLLVVECCNGALLLLIIVRKVGQTVTRECTVL